MMRGGWRGFAFWLFSMWASMALGAGAVWLALSREGEW